MSRNRFQFLLAVTSLILFPLLVLLGAFVIPPQYGRTYLAEFPEKMRLLSESDGRKIVIVGGSSAAFGVDTALMEEELPAYRVINYGLYAAMGSRMMLETALEYAEPGDILIFLPEQNTQTLSMNFDAGLFLEAVDGQWKARPEKGLSGEEKKALLEALPLFAYHKIRYDLTGSAPDPKGVYQKASFNARGDLDYAGADHNVMRGYYDANFLIRYDAAYPDDEFTDFLNRSARIAAGKGAALWYAFAPANRLAIADPGAADSYAAALSERLTFPVVGDPKNSILDPEWFYDTNYHLNHAGRTLYTKNLIRMIKARLADTSATNITVPAAPALPEEDSHLSAAELAAALAYTRNASGAVTEITVPASIIFLPDGFFRQYPELSRIHFDNQKPSDISVGTEMLEGSNADIYVPKDALSDYLTDYRFSLYADRIHGE